MYDRDGSGEIDPEEMEDIFKKLCKIAAGIESDQNKIKAKVCHRTHILYLTQGFFSKEMQAEKLKEQKEKEKREEEKARAAAQSLRGQREPRIYSRCIHQYFYDAEILTSPSPSPHS